MDLGLEGAEGSLRSRLRRWIFLTGDRRLVTVVVLLASFAVINTVDVFYLGRVPAPLAEENTTVSLVTTLLSGTFFLFSIVVSVNSLVVSQQQNPLDQQFGRVQSVIEYRRQLEDALGVDHVPARPNALVRLLAGEILERAQTLQEDLSTADIELQADFETYLDSLADETGEMNAALARADTTFEILLAMMDYNHDRQINDLRALRARHGETLADETEALFGDILRLLEYFAAAREYFKTLAIRREFAVLSRDLVLISAATVGLVASFLHFLTDLPDSTVLVAGVEAVAFAPFVLVGAYVLRVAVVSYRTQAAGQFVVDEEYGDIEGMLEDRSER